MNKSPSASQSTPSDAIQLLSTQMLSMDVAQWTILVARINEPTTARIIVEYLDGNSVQKNRYAGIYLRARDTVQRSRVRYAKAYRWGQLSARFVAWISRFSQKATVASPIRAQDSIRKETPVPPLVWPELIWS